MKHRILTIVCMIGAGLAACVVLDKPAGVQAAISNPSYFKSLIIGGGITDADGGAQIEDNGNITTTGDLAVDDLTVGDDLSITGDLNVDGITTLDMPVNIYDATTDPDALGAFVALEEDSSKAQFIVNGQMGAIDDFDAPSSIALLGVLGPIGDAGNGEAPRLGLKSPNGVYLDMYADDHTVTMNIYDTSDTTLVIENPDGTRQGNLAVENLITTRLINIGGGYGSVGASIDGSGNVSTNGSLIVDGKRRATPDNNTITSGSIAYESEYQRTDTEGAASTDDLVTVTGGTNGDVMFLRSTSAARDIVLKHGTGTDNLTLRDGVDFTLDNTFDVVGFVRGTTSWFEIFRTDSGGSGTPAESGTYNPTLSVVSNLTSLDLISSTPWQYNRIGSVVTVSGRATGTVTTTGAISFTATLPISSNFTNDGNCVGICAVDPSVNSSGIVSGDTTLASVICRSVKNGSNNFYVHFTYRIL